MKTTNPGDLLVLLGIVLGLFLVISGAFDEWRRRKNTKMILDAVAEHIAATREENRKTHAGLALKLEKIIEQADRGIVDEAFRIANNAREKRKQKGKK